MSATSPRRTTHPAAVGSPVAPPAPAAPSSTGKPASRRRKNVRGAHLYRRGKVWYAYLPEFPDGISLKTTDAKEAAQKLRGLVTDAAKRPGKSPNARGLPREESLATIVDAWVEAPHGYTSSTLESSELRATAWLTWLDKHGVTMPSEITATQLDRWMSERAEKVSRRTINRDLRVLRVVLRWGASRGMCAENTVVQEREGMREAERTERATVPSPTEMTAILTALHARHRTIAAAVRVLYATGLRVGELRRLAVGDLHDGAVWVRPEMGPAATAQPTKGYRERSIPLAEGAQELVTAYLARVMRRQGKHPSSRTIHRQIVAACVDAKVKPCGVHDMRRAAATEWSRAGASISLISRWLGHRLIRTTERYLSSYRSDAQETAPMPAVLTAEKLPKVGGVSGHFEAEKGSAEGRGRRAKKP